MDVKIFRTVQGQEPFTDWLLSLRNKIEQARIRQRLDRVSAGNLGDYKTVGDGVFELRFLFGAGYRVYFGFVEGRIFFCWVGEIKQLKIATLKKQKHIGRNINMGNFRDFRALNLSLLREPEDANVYLQVALEEYENTGDTDALLSVLRDVTEAQGGMTQMAQKINRSRQSLYKALSPKGNPRLDTFLLLLHALGLRLAIEPQRATLK